MYRLWHGNLRFVLSMRKFSVCSSIIRASFDTCTEIKHTSYLDRSIRCMHVCLHSGQWSPQSLIVRRLDICTNDAGGHNNYGLIPRANHSNSTQFSQEFMAGPAPRTQRPAFHLRDIKGPVIIYVCSTKMRFACTDKWPARD